MKPAPLILAASLAATPALAQQPPAAPQNASCPAAKRSSDADAARIVTVTFDGTTVRWNGEIVSDVELVCRSAEHWDHPRPGMIKLDTPLPDPGNMGTYAEASMRLSRLINTKRTTLADTLRSLEKR